MQIVAIFYNMFCRARFPTDTGLQEPPSSGRIGLGPSLRLLIGIPLGLLMVPLALVLTLLFRVLSPILLIRVGPIGGTGRIGNFAPDIEFYLSERDELPAKPRRLDLFFYLNPPFNQQLKTMADRKLLVFPFVRLLDLINGKLPGHAKHSIEMNIRVKRQPDDIHALLSRTPVHIGFTKKEEELGQRALRDLGVPQGAPYVCFHARDNGYLNTYYPKGDWHYHDYRDCSADNYVPAMEDLAGKGYFAIRMGSGVNRPLATKTPGVIDYASTARTDFLDIYLTRYCKFFIASASGIDTVATIFRRPIAFANWAPMGFPGTMGPRDIFIAKRLWLRAEGRFLTFREIVQSEIGIFDTTEQYEQLGIDVVENTPEEVAGLTMEMEQRLRGGWEHREEDEELQRRFWSVFEPLHRWQPDLTRVGTDFLRRNVDLLE